MRMGALALPVLLLAGGCGSARGAVDVDALALTARQAWAEARSQARGWSTDARLRYVEGAAVDNQGRVLPDAGYWRFVYDAPGESQQLAVTVRPTDVEATERAPQSPPGFVIGDRVLGSEWIDSPAAIAAAPAFDTGTRVPMLLVPTSPERWFVTYSDGRVGIDAATGARVE